MKLKYTLIFLLLVILNTFSQEKSEVLFTINNEPYYTQEFLNVYAKNSNLIKDSKANSIENYLKLFVDYKLKVKQAKELKLDTLQKFKNELSEYKSKLILPYLKDEKVTEKLLNEAYERLQKEVEVSHILIMLKPNYSSVDTLQAFNKLIEARNLILAGNDFSEIAKKYSQDRSVHQNNGKIGYFTALQMVYPFENVAYSTPVSQVSMPFKTKFGYHILKVHNIRKSRGEVEAAHIMIKNNNANAKQKIDSIYNQLIQNKADFESVAKQVSEDRASAVNGGKLAKFGTGQMIEDFADVAFSLTKEGGISKPFQTQFGWHIVKLLKKYPLESFESIGLQLRQQVEKDERSILIEKSVINKLQKDYKIDINKSALYQFETDDWRNNSNSFQQLLLSINGLEIYQQQFIKYLKKNSYTNINSAFNNFKDQELLNYYKNNIETSNKEFATIFNEFKDGLLLFDLLEKTVWEKSKDSVGLANFYKINKVKKYNNQHFETIKGVIIADYQNYLEQNWVNALRKKYKVSFNNSEKKRVLKSNTN